jgi:hypothetical protein
VIPDVRAQFLVSMSLLQIESLAILVICVVHSCFGL